MTSDQRENYDACVVGAGPAGALAARSLALRGRRVLLVDKATFPRPKVCGGCLGGVGFAALQEAGLSLDALGVEHTLLDRLTVLTGGRQASLPLRRRAAIDREPFDDRLLAKAIEAGVEVRTGVRASVAAPRDGAREVTLSTDGCRETVAARVVLLAAGLGAPGVLTDPADRIESIRRPGSRVGAGVTVEDDSLDLAEGRVLMACSDGGAGYVGLVRLPDGRVDAAAALAPAAVREAGGGAGGVGALVGRILERTLGAAPTSLRDAAWRSTPTLTQRPARLASERLLLVGDAAGYVEPFTGEGIGWALRSAIEATPIADEAIDNWRPELAEWWQTRHARTVGRYQRRCRWVCGLVGARVATPAVVRLLSAAPWAATGVLRSIDGPRPAAA